MASANSSSFQLSTFLVFVLLCIGTSLLFSQLFGQKPQFFTAGITSSTSNDSAEVADADTDVTNVLDETGKDTEDKQDVAPDTATSGGVVADTESGKTGTGVVDPGAGPSAPPSFINKFRLVMANSDQACGSATLWNDGEQEVAQHGAVGRCFSLNVATSKSLDLLILQVRKNDKPRALLINSCRPIGFPSAQTDSAQDLWFPRTVDGGRGALMPVESMGDMSYVVVGKTANVENAAFKSLTESVSTICGQQASIDYAELMARLDELNKSDMVSVESLSVKF